MAQHFESYEREELEILAKDLRSEAFKSKIREDALTTLVELIDKRFELTARALDIAYTNLQVEHGTYSCPHCQCSVCELILAALKELCDGE